jgi:hypothetical protein
MIRANRTCAGRRAIAVRFICKLQHARAIIVVAKKTTKVRPDAQATTPTGTRSLLVDGEVDSRSCAELAAMADLSDSKHEDFDKNSCTPALPCAWPHWY